MDTRETDSVTDLLLDAAKEGAEDKLDNLLMRHGKEMLNSPVDKRWGKTALHLLVEAKSVVGVELLLKKGADVMVEDNAGDIALRYAVYHYNLEMVKALLKFGDKRAQILKRRGEPEVTFRFFGLKQTPMHSAAYSDYRLAALEEMVRALKEASACAHEQYLQDLNFPDENNGNTPLHTAVYYGVFQCAQLLLQSGASPRSYNERGDTPFHFVVHSFKKPVEALEALDIFKNHDDFRYIIDDQNRRNGRSVLHDAAASGSVEVVEWLVRQNASVCLEDIEGNTPLHLAAMVTWKLPLVIFNRQPISLVIEKLLCHQEPKRTEMKKDSQSEEGQLDITHEGHDKDQTQPEKAPSQIKWPVLTMKGVELLLKENKEGKWALAVAHKDRQTEAAKTMVTAAISTILTIPQKADKIRRLLLDTRQRFDGAALLHFFAAYGTEADLEQFASSFDKEELRVCDRNGMNAVHWAASRGNIPALHVLAKHDVPLNESQYSQWTPLTPLYLAVFVYRNMEFASVLMQKLKASSMPARSYCSKVLLRKWMREFYKREWMSYEDCKFDSELANLEQDLKTYEPELGLSREGISLEIPPIFLALYAEDESLAKFIQEHSSKGAAYDAVNARGKITGRTALHWAIILRKRHIVAVLCKSTDPNFKDRLIATVEDKQGKTALQYALARKRYQGVNVGNSWISSAVWLSADDDDDELKDMELNDKDIEKELMLRDDVKGQVEALYKDRQLYVDAANAILVAAALIASVTFAGWLQPPLSYVDYYNLPDPTESGQFQAFAAVQQNMGVRFFWIFNSLSFSFAVATVLAALIAVVPTPRVYLGTAVTHLNRWLIVAALLLGISIVFVLAAFAAAGFAVLPPFFKYQRSMLVTSVVGPVFPYCCGSHIVFYH